MVDIEVILQGFAAQTNQGMLAYCSVILLRGVHTTLVDVGYQARQAILLERLRAAGVRREDVDRVVLTHAHWDHALNLLAFPKAEVVLHRDECDYLDNPDPDDWATPRFTRDILARCSSVTAVGDGDELEPGVRVMAVPGHSPGSLAVLVETAEGIAGMVGDALPGRAAASAPVPSARLVFFDEAAAQRSARRIIDSCRTVYPGHDRPFRVESGGFVYFEPTSLVLLNPPRDEDGTVRASVDATPVPFETIVHPSARRAASRGFTRRGD